ncbi:39 kda fk506-binding nuclear protein [Anaeramoeba flamelloides]|uniref:39 kDa fk506-binding nuclear protein n=1 Tax=Anaeramoeba flamelloides TaxID=1746091 RepID=A0ABQ8XT63_9EUKA|nr:39 kda fk506-binding nuclear protein [Anaeramoeba flamelloides]
MYGNGGLEIKQSEKYSLELNTQMNLISATLDLKAKKGERVNLYAHKNNSKILLCSLKKGLLENFRLDVPFNPFQTIRFSAEGDGDASIHIFFFNNPPDEEYGMDDDDDDEDFNEIIEEQVNYFKNKLKEGDQILPDSDELDSKKHELLNEMMEKEMEKKKNKKNKKVQEKETKKKNNKNQNQKKKPNQNKKKNNNNNKNQNKKNNKNQNQNKKQNQKKKQKNNNNKNQNKKKNN